ncbi:MAG TPA: DinB family protein, partial [Gemmataceae bacterium]|nr:DinB family protein [Gemmataceae bacterium]
MNHEISDLIESALANELEQLRDAVKKLVDALSHEELWKKPLDPGNSIGHLILHLTGSLNHFVGAHLGKTGYVRNREREFTETNLPKKEALLKGLDDAVALYRRVVTGLSA